MSPLMKYEIGLIHSGDFTSEFINDGIWSHGMKAH